MLLPVPLPSSFLLFFHQLLSSFSENTGWEVFFEGFKIFNYSLQISDLKQRARTIFFSNTDIVPFGWQPVKSKTSLQPIPLNSFLSLFTQITLQSSCHKLATATYALSLSISALLKILLELFWKRLCLAATNDVCIKKKKSKLYIVILQTEKQKVLRFLIISFSGLSTGYILSGLSVSTHTQETWEFVRDNEENNCIIHAPCWKYWQIKYWLFHTYPATLAPLFHLLPHPGRTTRNQWRIQHYCAIQREFCYSCEEKQSTECLLFPPQT